jgi:hypothetical protein
MKIWEWMKMEEIFEKIFKKKCERSMEYEYKKDSGEKKKKLVK